MAVRNIPVRRLLVVGALIVAVGLVGLSDTLSGQVHRIIALAKDSITGDSAAGMVVFVLLATLSAMVAFFSSAVLAPVAIHAWGPTTTAILLWLGWLIGGMSAYFVGRFLRRGAAARLIGEARLTHWESRIGQRLSFVHILGFQAVVPSEIPGYVLGVLRYPFFLYLAALAVTEIPYAIGVTFLGESFLRGNVEYLIAVGVLVLIMATALWLKTRTARVDTSDVDDGLSR